jgi:hypothetical protein
MACNGTTFFTGILGPDKQEAMKRGVSSQQHVFRKNTMENEAPTRVSIRIAQITAKAGKPFTNSDVVVATNCQDFSNFAKKFRF